MFYSYIGPIWCARLVTTKGHTNGQSIRYIGFVIHRIYDGLGGGRELRARELRGRLGGARGRLRSLGLQGVSTGPLGVGPLEVEGDRYGSGVLVRGAFPFDHAGGLEGVQDSPSGLGGAAEHECQVLDLAAHQVRGTGRA